MNRALQIFAVTVGTALSSSLLFAQPPGRGGPPGMGGQGGRGGPPMEMITELFEQADTNQDGSVTKEELTTLMQNQGQRNQRGQGNQRGQRNQRGQAGRPPQGGNQQGGNQRGGVPRQGGNMEHGDRQAQHQPPREGGHQGPPPAPGQVLPERITQSLNLNAEQTRMLAALQDDVDKRLAAILTDEQKEQLTNARPPHGPDHGEGGHHREGGARGEAGNRGDGRPQRPQ